MKTAIILALLILVGATSPYSHACAPGFQLWVTKKNTICLEDEMIAYIACLNDTSKAQLEVENSKSDENSSTLAGGASGSGSGIAIKAHGKVVFQYTNANQAIKQLKQKFDPNNTTNCYKGAFGAKENKGSGVVLPQKTTGKMLDKKVKQLGKPSGSDVSKFKHTGDNVIDDVAAELNALTMDAPPIKCWEF